MLITYNTNPLPLKKFELTAYLGVKKKHIILTGKDCTQNKIPKVWLFLIPITLRTKSVITLITSKTISYRNDDKCSV